MGQLLWINQVIIIEYNGYINIIKHFLRYLLPSSELYLLFFRVMGNVSTVYNNVACGNIII